MDCPTASFQPEQVEENVPYLQDLRDVTSVEDAAIEAYDAIKDRA